ncbi:PD-(D/E)XK motif protein, partial [bacterium]|nr:PD-(D/E)XK motif protein [bacterium]
KLASAGYIHMDEYNKISFAVTAKQNYAVVPGFPRLVRKDLPIEIVKAEYQLDLPSLTPWAK